MAALAPRLPGLFLIGERLNSHRPEMAGIVGERDAAALRREVRRQQRRGATHLDFCAAGSAVAGSGDAERAALLWMLETALPVLDEQAGIAIDSPNPGVIAAGLELVGARKGTLINGMSADFEHIQKLLPLAAKSDAGLILILGSASQAPRSADERLGIASQLMEIAGKARIGEERLFLDPQVLPLASDAAQPGAVLRACLEIRRRWPAAHVLAGLSNVSFNLPRRRLLNRTFAAMLLACGVDTLLCDPCDRHLQRTLLAAQALLGKDDFFATYLSEAERQRGR